MEEADVPADKWDGAALYRNRAPKTVLPVGVGGSPEDALRRRGRPDRNSKKPGAI